MTELGFVFSFQSQGRSLRVSGMLSGEHAPQPWTRASESYDKYVTAKGLLMRTLGDKTYKLTGLTGAKKDLV